MNPRGADPHQQRGAVIGRDRAHRDAEFAVAKEGPQHREQQQKRRDHRDLPGANANASEADDGAADAQVEPMRIGVPDEADRRAQDDR